MDLFGLNRFIGGPDGGSSPQKGPARWFQALWDNLGGLLAGNLLTFAGFLPLALGVSLGLVYENLWITLLSGAAGGALAGLFWGPMVSLSIQALRGNTAGWLGRWRRGIAKAPLAAAGAGAVLGLLTGGLLQVENLLSQLLGQGGTPSLIVWAVLCADLFLLSGAAAVWFPALCVCPERERPGLRPLAGMLAAAPGRVCAAALAALAWCALGVALFPVSVPFSVVLGFWPPALTTAQLLLPALEGAFDLSQWAPDPAPSPAASVRNRGEIWWRRRWPAVLILTAVAGLLLWGGSGLFARREPDLQIAVVHAQPLPDSVRQALEDSLATLVGDRNGDGVARAQVNDYVVVFDGSAANADMQTAGATLLVSDVAAGVSALYVVEDPEGFLARYSDRVDGARRALWADCPALVGLDAGTYSTLEDIETDLTGQSLLAPLSVLPSLDAGDGAPDLLPTPAAPAE